MKPRQYQIGEWPKIREAFETHRRVLYILPSGGGKTFVASMGIREFQRSGRRVLVLVHRVELLEQMQRTLVGVGLSLADVGIIWRDDERTNHEAPVQVASIDTLLRREMPGADLIVVDEAHHAAAKKWQRILAQYPTALVLGLTATPFRFDEAPLSTAFDTIVSGPTMSELFAINGAETPLTKPRVFVPDAAVDLWGVRKAGRDFDRHALGLRMGQKKVVARVAQHYVAYAKDVRAVLFAATVANGKRYLKEFAAISVKAELLTGETPMAERRALLDPGGRLDRGVTRVVVNCEVLTEGWDLPSVKCIVMARPTLSRGLYIQMAGRGIRRWQPAGSELPAVPILLDCAGNARRHGLPWDPYDVSLNTSGTARIGAVATTCWRCECGTVNEMGDAICHECATARPPADRETLDRKDARLRELEPPPRPGTEQWVSLAARLVAVLGREPTRSFLEKAIAAGWR